MVDKNDVNYDAEFIKGQVEKIEEDIFSHSNLTEEQKSLWEDYKEALKDIPAENREARENLYKKFQEDLKATENTAEKTETKPNIETKKEEPQPSEYAEIDYTAIAPELEEKEIAAGIPDFKKDGTNVKQPETEKSTSETKVEQPADKTEEIVAEEDEQAENNGQPEETGIESQVELPKTETIEQSEENVPADQELTWRRSPLIEDKKGEMNWHFDENGQFYYDMAGLSSSAREQVQQILGSHGVKTQDDGDALYLKNPKQMKALKKAWARARQYKDYNSDLLIEPKGPLVEWNSPGMEKYWCHHHGKFYLNIDGFGKPVVDATEQYLKNVGIEGFGYAQAPKNLKTKNPQDNSIVQGQKVIVIEDPEDIKKLKQLWSATKRAPELANPPKGMLPNGMPTNEQDIVPPTSGKEGKSGKKTKPFVDQLNMPKGGKGFELGPIGDALGLVGKQVENVGGSFIDTLGKFTDNTLGKSFSSPEEFGEEFLYQMMAFPLEWLKAYFDTIAKDDSKKKADMDKLLDQIGKAQKAAGLQSPFAGKVPEYTPEMHKQRVQAMRDFFNRPENADKKEMLKQMAQTFGQHPEFKQAYDKMFPNAPFGFEEAMNALNAQTQAQTKVQPTLTGGKQPTISPEIAALMQRVEQLEQKQMATEEKLANKEVELAQEKAKNKQQEEKIAALQQKLAALEQGKTQPVEAPKNQYKAEEKAFMEATTAEEKQAHLNNLAPSPVPNVEAYKAQMQAEAKVQAQPAPNPEQPTQPENNSGAEPPVPPTEKTQTPASETVSIRDLNTLDAKDPSKGAEVVAKLEDLKSDYSQKGDDYAVGIVEIVQDWYKKPIDERSENLNDILQNKKDVEVADRINNEINDGYDKDIATYKKVIELKDSVDKEKLFADRERLHNMAQADLAKRRPDLYAQMKLANDEKGEAVLSIGELNVQYDQTKKRDIDNDEAGFKFSTEPSSKLDEVMQKYNLSTKDKRDLRIILTYFSENTNQANTQNMSMAQVKKGQSR